MNLLLLFFIPMLGAIIAWLSGRLNSDYPRLIAAVATLLLCFIPLAGLWLNQDGEGVV